MRHMPMLARLLVSMTLVAPVMAGCAADDATPSVDFDRPGWVPPADTTPGGADAGGDAAVGPDVPTPDVAQDVAPDVAPDVTPDVAPTDTGPDAACATDGDCDGVLDLGACEVPRCEQGSCVPAPVADGEACDDGDACTEADACLAGVCAGVAKSCDDGNPCTTDLCGSDGVCATVHNSDACDDGNPCTAVDTCDAGACVGVGNGCTCATDADCAPKDDADPCNGTLSCQAGLCEVDPATVPDCAVEAGPCAVGACVTDVGCTADLLPDGATCDDGDPCTGAGVCDAGQCLVDAVEPCEDGNPCTLDTCDESGKCVHLPAEGPCDDGDACTVDDACKDGKCKAGPKKDCDDGTICTDDGCSLGTCVHVPTWEQPCDDEDACTVGDACKDGACLPGAAADCDDTNACTEDLCLADAGCVHEPVDGPCDDGDLCTQGDACVGGVCTPAQTTDCADDNPCTEDACLADGGCEHLALDGDVCDDGDACTGGDQCVAGTCDPGAFDLCGACAGAADLSACDDGDALTAPDVCVASACVGFTRRAWMPGSGAKKTEAAALVDVAFSEGKPVAAGWRVDNYGATTSFVAALSATADPAAMTGSERTDTVYRAVRHRVAVGTSGRVSFQTGATWDSTPGLWTALKTISGLGDLTDVWGTSLAAPVGQTIPKEQWLLGGLQLNGTSPFIARCAREPNPAGGYKWYCEDLSTLPVGGVGPGGLWAAPVPCDGASCLPASLSNQILVGNQLPAASDNLIFESGAGIGSSWGLASNVDGVPGDLLTAVDGASMDDVWAVGTHGLWARRDANGWAKGAALEAAGGSVDLEAVQVVGGRVWVVGTRHTYSASLDRAELVILTAATDGGALSTANLAVLATHECVDVGCQVGEDVHGNNGLTGVLLHAGTLWIVGREWTDGAQKTVVYSAPVP